MTTRPLLAEVLHEGEVVNETAELRKELRVLREELETFKKTYQQERRNFLSLLQCGRVVFGDRIEREDGEPAMPASAQPPDEAAWRMWKQRLPGACPKVIDALLIQPLTPTQLISATGTSYSTVQRALTVLRNNSLLEIDGSKIRLKRI